MLHLTNETEIGYIYCLSNKSYKDTYKIGYTKNDPLTRMAQLNTTGLLYPFNLEFAKQVVNYQDKEKKLHLIFDKYRVNKSREFFKVELSEIKQLFDLIDGEWYKINKPIKVNVLSPKKEQTETKYLFGSNQINYNSTNNKDNNVKTLIQNVENTFYCPYKNEIKTQNIHNTHCSRCYDKLNIQKEFIKCNHFDICKDCINVIKKCPKCKIPYNL